MVQVVKMLLVVCDFDVFHPDILLSLGIQVLNQYDIYNILTHHMHKLYYVMCIHYCTERLEETHEDKLRSIIAQLEYSYEVCDYDKKGVPFHTYIYVPEKHPITGSECHEREDDAHVLKVC